MSRLQLAKPLPECSTCGRAVRRARWSAQGGLCALCVIAYGGRPGCACSCLCDAYPTCQEPK